jgi:mannose-6-phosphate isomerase-like protein (cupin superfamily)
MSAAEGGLMDLARTIGTPLRRDDQLDGVRVAPAHHHVLFENECVRVVESVIAVGERTPLHTHLGHRVMFALSGTSFVRRNEHGAVIESTRIPDGAMEDRVMWGEPTDQHTIENTGDQDLVVIAVEVPCDRQGAGHSTSA